MINLWVLFLLFTLVCSSTLVTASEYEIILDPDPDMDMYKGGAAGTLSFWELPLSLQAVYISGLLGTSLAVHKFLPLLLGRVRQNCKNQNRNDILEFITANPGTTSSDIEKHLELNRSTIRYHLKILQVCNKIKYVRKGKIVMFIKNSSRCTDTEKIAFVLKNDTRKTILISISRKPGITNQDLTQIFNLSKSTVHWHINELHNEGLVHFKSDGKYKRCFVDPAIEVDLENAILESETPISAN